MQRLADDTLHREKRFACCGAPKLVHGDNVWMFELRRELCFLQKQREQPVVDVLFAQPLQRDVALEIVVFDLEDVAAAAASDLANKVVAGLRCRSRRRRGNALRRRHHRRDRSRCQLDDGASAVLLGSTIDLGRE